MVEMVSYRSMDSYHENCMHSHFRPSLTHKIKTRTISIEYLAFLFMSHDPYEGSRHKNKHFYIHFYISKGLALLH